MNTEQAMIGQRMRERLLASGWLCAVEMELQEESFILTLTPRHTMSECLLRLLRFCVNIFGEVRPPTCRHGLFGACAAFASCADDQRCQVWVACDCSFTGFNVITELVLLAFKISHVPPALCEHRVYALENLVQVYRTKDDVLAWYEGMVAQIIADGDDLPTEGCEPSLRTCWACCPKHRYLFVQRLLVAHWLYHLLAAWELDEEYAVFPGIDYLVDYPQQEEMQQRLSRLLARTLTPQEWLQEYVAYVAQSEREHWERPIKDVCQRKHHISLSCCPFHGAMNAIEYFFSAWLVHFGDCYHLRFYVDEQGYAPPLLGGIGIALLMHLAKLSTEGMSLPTWFEQLSRIDLSTFHMKEEHDSHKRP